MSLSSAAGTNIQTVCVTFPITDITYNVGGSATGASITAGALPAGVTGTFAGGVFTITGTPTTAIGSPFNYTVTTSGGACSPQISLTGTITVRPASTLSLSSVAGTDAQTVCVNTPITSITYAVGGSATSASITAGALPAGVTGSFSGGVFTISGSPSVFVASPYSYTVTTSGGCAPDISLSGTITVTEGPSMILSSAIGTNIQTVCVASPITDITYNIGGSATGASITAGALPTGVTGTFAAGVFTITGTPTTAVGSPFNYTVTTTGGACLPQISLTGTITVTAGPSLTLTSAAATSTQAVCINAPITNITYAVGGSATSASITAGALPAGVTGTLVGGVFTISGTPTTSVGSPFNYTITTSGGPCAPHISLSGTITINTLPTFTLSSSNPTACAASDGSITISGLTASVNYTISYNDDAVPVSLGSVLATAGGTYVISSLNAGSYTNFSVTLGSSGCAGTNAIGVTLSNPGAPVVDDIADQVLCNVGFTLPVITGTLLTGSEGYWSGLNGTGTNYPVGSVISTTGTTIYIYDALGACTSQQNFLVTIQPLPTITLSSLAGTAAQTVCVNSPITAITYSIGGSATGASITAGALPAGVTGSFAAGVFTISGTPTTAIGSPFSYTVTTSGGVCSPISLSGTITVTPPSTLTLTSAVTTDAQTVCQNLSITSISYAIGGSATGAAITAGALPAGVAGSFVLGVFTITGTPTSIIGSPFNYTVTTSGGCVPASLSGTIAVTGLPTISLTSGASTNAQTICVNTPLTSISYAVGGSATTASITAGALPSGVTGSFAAGVFTISGTPTTAIGSPFNYTVTTSGGACSPQLSLSGTITVDSAPTNILTSAVGTDAQVACVNEIITSITYAIGGTSSSASITAGALPAGVTGAYSAGVFTISGTPTTAIGSPFNYTVTAAGTCLPSVSLSGTITVNALPTFTLSSIDPSICAAADGSVTISGLTASSSYSISYNDDAVPVSLGIVSSTAGGTYVISSLNAGSYTNFSVTLNTSGCVGINSAGVTLSNPGAPVVNDIADQLLCNVGFTLPIITGTLLTGSQGYWSGLNGTGTNYPVGSVIAVTGTTVYIYDALGACTSQQNFLVTIDPLPTIVLSSVAGTSAQTICVNSALINISYTIGGSATSASITSGSLPAGLTGTFSGGVFTISGIPTTAVGSPFSYTVTTSGGACSAVSLSGTIAVDILPTLALTSAIGTDAQTVCENTVISNITYLIGGSATGAILSGGALPAGVTGSFAAGVFTISGTPTTAIGSPFSYTISVSGGTCTPISLSGTITVDNVPSLSLTSIAGTDAQSTCVNSAITSISYLIGGSASGASISAGVLPAGVTGSFVSGVYTISGTPTSPVGSPFSYTITTSGGSCVGSSLSGTITVDDFPTISLSSAIGTDAQTNCVNTAITNISYLIGGSATGAAITAGALPTGVLGSYAAGVFTISGTPTVSGPYWYTVSTTGGACVSVSLGGTIVVDAIPTNVLTSALGTDVQVICENTSLTNIDYTIGGGATNASITAGTLPAGVTGAFSAGIFTISGTPISSIGSPFNYTVTTFGGSCPDVSQSGTISIDAVPTATLSSAIGTDAQVVCQNTILTDIVYIIAGDATSASITAGALPAGVTGVFAGGIFTISGTPTLDGSFTYTVTTSGGTCSPDVSVSGTIDVTIAPVITLTSAVGTDAQINCFGSPLINIDYTISGGATGATISAGSIPAGVTGVYDGVAGIFTISGTPTSSVGSPFSYTVETIGGSCGVVSLSGTIDVIEQTLVLTSAPLTNTQIICLGSPIVDIEYTIGGGATGAVLSAGALPAGLTGSFSGGIFTITGTPSALGTFYYSVSSVGSCASVVDIGSIIINPILVGNSAGADISICDGTSTTLVGGTATGGDGIYTYLWESSLTAGGPYSPAVGINNGSDYTTATLGVTTYYIRTVTSGGCSDISTEVTVTVDASPTGTAGGTVTLCSLDPATVSGATVTNGTVLWTHDGAGSIIDATTLTPTYTPVAADIGNTVLLTMTVTSTTPCVPLVTPTATYTIIVNGAPVSPVNAGIDDTVNFGSSINLNATVTSIASWVWTPSLELDDPSIFNPTATPSATTTYTVTATHLNGCISADSVIIVVNHDFDLIITNVLTPNGDGKNDTWKIENIESYPNTEVIVVNREGQFVFEDTNYSNNWDGKYEGKYLPDATYYYIVKFAGSDKVYKGAVTILRGKQ